MSGRGGTRVVVRVRMSVSDNARRMWHFVVVTSFGEGELFPSYFPPLTMMCFFFINVPCPVVIVGQDPYHQVRPLHASFRAMT